MIEAAATRTADGEGRVRQWPDEIEMSADVKELLTRRWAQYGPEESD